jgi:hypothetical protein
VKKFKNIERLEWQGQVHKFANDNMTSGQNVKLIKCQDCKTADWRGGMMKIAI